VADRGQRLRPVVHQPGDARLHRLHTDFAPDGKILVTRRWAQSVAVVDPLTEAFQTMQTGRSPHGIWLNTHDTFFQPESVTSDRFSMLKHGA